MKRFACSAVAAFALQASAAVIGIAEPGDGSAVVFHDEAGPCVGGALRAEYRAKDGTNVPGCYVIRGAVALVVFFDTDMARVPVQAIQPPKQV